MSNLPSTCPEEETFEGTETWEERTFNTFFEFEREGFKVLQNFSAEPSERRFTYPVDHFHEKSFLKCDVFAWLLGRCARRFGLFAESILLEISKNLFTCSKLCFGSNFCLKIGLHIPNFKQKSFESIVKTFRERWQNYMPQDLLFLENNVFRIIYQFLSFRTLSVNFLVVWRTLLIGLSKLLFMGLEDIFVGKKIEWKLHNLLEHKRRFLGETSVGNLRFTSTHSKRQKKRVFCEDLFGRVVKTESLVSRRYYRRKTFIKIFIIFSFFGLSPKFSRMLGEIFLAEKKSLQFLTLS